MANKIIKSSLKHYYDEVAYTPTPKPEVDKSKTISDLSREELWQMLSRTRDELELQRIIRQLKINSGERETSDKLDSLFRYQSKRQCFQYVLLDRPMDT